MTDWYRRDWKLQDRYGLTLAEYDALLIKQAGVCAICLRLPRGIDRFLVVDHTASDGIRGLLCRGCNRHLGKLEAGGWPRHDEQWVLMAWKYLRRNGLPPTPKCRRGHELDGRCWQSSRQAWRRYCKECNRRRVANLPKVPA